ncbi:hypothetical protein ABTE71_20915, partial [Acinetobacter baumannii]
FPRHCAPAASGAAGRAFVGRGGDFGGRDSGAGEGTGLSVSAGTGFRRERGAGLAAIAGTHAGPAAGPRRTHLAG